MGPYTYTMATIQRLNTTYTKDNHNPVQMDVDKLFLYKTLKKKHSTGSLRSQLSSSDDLEGLSAASLKRRKSAQLELKMRARTAHNGRERIIRTIVLMMPTMPTQQVDYQVSFHRGFFNQETTATITPTTTIYIIDHKHSMKYHTYHFIGWRRMLQRTI